MDGHLPALAQILEVAAELMSHLLDRQTTPKEGTGLTILREDQVIHAQRSRRANVRRLFTRLSHIKADTGLPLRLIEHAVGFVDEHHCLKYFL